MRTRLIALVAGMALLTAACGGDAAADDGPLVIVTTTVLGDVVSSAVGSDAVVEVLMPIGADPHDFEPSSRQVAQLEAADLVVAVGLDLEEGLADLLESVEADGVRVLRVGPLVAPNWVGDSVVLDPHIWMDPLRMALVVDHVAAEMSNIGLEGSWEANAAAARTAYEALDAEIRAELDAVPAERRLLVSGHDSLGYLAARYDLRVVGAVVEGGSTLAQPSSAHLAELIDEIETLGIPAVFGETTEPSALLDAIAAEPGLDVVVVELHIGSLGEPGTVADTYVGMMRENARLIREGLTR